jgi:LacI family transcriptional regulator
LRRAVNGLGIIVFVHVVFGVSFDVDQMSSPGSRTVGIKEIAEALGVSIGTVDRALHGRPGINPMTRKRVLKMAETMGYRPNLAARFLKSKKRLLFSVELPDEIASFFDAVRDGIRQAASPFDANVSLQFQRYRRLGERDSTLFEETLASGTSGIIISPGRPAELKSLIRKAAQQNIPVVCVATDAPGTERLTVVSTDSYTSGAMAAELLCRFRQVPGAIAVCTGFLDTVDHAEKLRGFRAAIERFSAGAPVQVFEAHDDEREAFARTRELIGKTPDLTAIYVSTANSLPVIRAVEEAGLMGKVDLVTTDVFPELVPLIRSGAVAATIYQRPISQGRIAFDVLYRFVVEGKCPPATIKLMPHVVMSSNLDLVLGRLPVELA